MQRVKFFIIVVLVVLLAGCVSASDKQLKLAQQSVAQGDYTQAFDRGAASLLADISNRKAISLFPAIVQGAYAQKSNQSKQYRARQHWDQAAYGYDRIIAMNQKVKEIQYHLNSYGQTAKVSAADRQAINVLLNIKPRAVTKQRNAVYQKAAEGHYVRAQQYVGSKQHRQAHAEFSKSLSFIATYKNARALAVTSKRLADLADASMHYGQAVAAVNQQQHRAAAIAFAKAEALVAGFKDAHRLAVKYKRIADQEDASDRYNKGQRLAQNHQYRPAVKAFQAAVVFVPGYRDAARLSARYTHLANKEDARRYYNNAMHLMDQQAFARAAQSFDKANQFVPGYRDARMMADKARSFRPPQRHQLQRMVQASVVHGIPLTWLHDVHQGYTEEVKITSVSVVQQGRFNHQREYWPYKLRLRGNCELEIAKGNEQPVSFDTVIDYRVFRDDFGAWKASFR